MRTRLTIPYLPSVPGDLSQLPALADVLLCAYCDAHVVTPLLRQLFDKGVPDFLALCFTEVRVI